ncbi:hypothetical protein [Burkholderia sp. Ac-20353]|uniref:hypothetical protein n=1 Tax=Burkholderia sp. Ac-20353 TaxID=2703894 RepID=UPI00197B2EC5|nr:hypothetical protein [Burkholderia sp. Ac-20353]MBN3791219.1 hypothetical protein [Burkholderia sp. Ac-20353]
MKFANASDYRRHANQESPIFMARYIAGDCRGFHIWRLTWILRPAACGLRHADGLLKGVPSPGLHESHKLEHVVETDGRFGAFKHDVDAPV